MRAAGDAVSDRGSQAPAPNDDHSLLQSSGFLDKIKHGTQALAHSTSQLLHKGLEHGKEIAQSPAAKNIEHQIVVTGKQIGDDHVRKARGLVEAGKAGDVQGVLRNGLPLAGEVIMGPQAAAIKIAKDKATEAAGHASDATNSTAGKYKPAARLPALIIDGLKEEEKHPADKR